MHTCPDCTYVEEQVEGNARYEIIDIGTHVKYLKEFLRLRDHSPVFDEDGTVTLSPEDAGLRPCTVSQGASCSINGKGC